MFTQPGSAFAQEEAAVQPNGHGFSVIQRFTGEEASHPHGGVLPLADGSILGTTWGQNAGTSNIFRIAPDGTRTTTQYFGSDLLGPRLVLASDGHIYGVSLYQAFRMEQDSENLVTLHTFSCCDGGPYRLSAPLVEATDGNFYGASGGGGKGVGTIFLMTPAGDVTVLHALRANGLDGIAPNAMIQAADGVFYGTTQAGGAHGYGVFFRVRADGTYKVLYDFDLATGTTPSGGLAQSPNGAIYGTAEGGGTYGHGTVYRVKPDDTLEVVHAFGATSGEGRAPSGLMRSPEGEFFGTTRAGGADDGNGYGTLYKINGSGNVTTLRKFVNFTGGRHPIDYVLALGPDGFLYGTCNHGGVRQGPGHSHGKGTVFKIEP